jgi:hypothetical protein
MSGNGFWSLVEMGLDGGLFVPGRKFRGDGAGRRTLKNAPSWQPNYLRPVRRRDGAGRRTFVFFTKSTQSHDVFNVFTVCFSEKTRFFRYFPLIQEFGITRTIHFHGKLRFSSIRPGQKKIAKRVFQYSKSLSGILANWLKNWTSPDGIDWRNPM